MAETNVNRIETDIATGIAMAVGIANEIETLIIDGAIGRT